MDHVSYGPNILWLFCCCYSVSCVWLFEIHGLQYTRLPCPSTNSRSLLKLISFESVMPSNYLIFCNPLVLIFSIFPSIRVFASELFLCIRWPKYWSFSFSFSPSNAYSGLIFFRIDLFEFVSVQGILKNLLQHHNLKALIFWHSVVFVVQLWKNQALTIRTLGKVMYK